MSEIREGIQESAPCTADKLWLANATDAAAVSRVESIRASVARRRMLIGAGRSTAASSSAILIAMAMFEKSIKAEGNDMRQFE